MSSYVTGHKAANNMAGVYPDNTWPARGRGDQETPRDGLGLFDNPRTEYLGALLRRTRGPGFNVGIVTTADLTDATPAANADLLVEPPGVRGDRQPLPRRARTQRHLRADGGRAVPLRPQAGVRRPRADDRTDARSRRTSGAPASRVS